MVYWTLPVQVYRSHPQLSLIFWFALVSVILYCWLSVSQQS